ncbi:hypothetical protein EROM_010500 [Encephalitozoon romaleae SJ-2008]|uniref:Uncharacterized protein n=1 Tax=Encephalitozoon romaleae (strain SJ-2008) TaxID=1178016 RepID=I7AL66_ENCRO|nr:hypothetical protein EROM_010500 [Encephalitozoon romaleae SJ-2008]AFN82394.1 hypothetical protein EROM_010500 [Encephalitozoon romaleae SJ-2008]
MHNPEDIVKEALITVPSPRRFPSLEIASGLEVPKTMSPRSLEDLNELYREMEFPTIEERMLDDHMALLDVLNNLSIEYNRYGLIISSELDELRKKQEEIALYDEYERECDILEVELANMKQKYEETWKYSCHEISDLRHRLDELRKMFNDMEYGRLHSNLINRIFAFLREEGPGDEEVVSSLGYVKETREYLNSMEKMLVLDEIGNIPDSYNKIVCQHLIHEESIELDKLGKILGVDRTVLLRIVYGLLSKGIIAFDRSEDRICLQR